MFNRLFGKSPDKIYKKIYDHIQKNNGRENFSPSGYALEQIREYLVHNPGECARLNQLITDKSAANSQDKIAGKISTAFQNLLIPEYRNRMRQEGLFGTNAEADALMAALDKLRPPAAVPASAPPKQQPVDDPKPYSVILVGDDGAGKHAIANSFVEERFRTADEPVVDGARRKAISVNHANLNLDVEVKGNRERFRNINAAFYLGHHGAVLVYDVTDAESFKNLKHWYEELRRYNQDDMPIIMVGNKCDLPNRVVDTDTAREFAEAVNIPYIECSAITGKNIAEIFKTLGKEMREQRLWELGTRSTMRPNM